MFDGLNPQQAEAVRRTEGPVLVLAGAGSGKTRVITRRIAYLVAEGIAAPEEILALTFTNKAAEEMRSRIAELVGRKVAERILLSTFHSFCLRVLRAECEHVGYRRNFTVSGEADTRAIVRRMLDDVAAVKESFSPAIVLERISLVKSGKTNLQADDSAKKDGANGQSTDAKYGKWLPDFYDRYQSALRAANTMDFDDLLLLTLRLWREHPRILARYQKQYRYIMVDEYQDTNRTQYELLSALVAAHRNLCVVGDDDQSIYAWRGAGIENILDFEREYHEAAVVRLEQNYRSTTTILQAANGVILNNRFRREKTLWSDLGAGRSIDWIVTGDDEHEAKEMVHWLQHILQKSNADFGDFALLYRSNLQSRPLEIALRQASIPYEVYGGQDFFERSEVRDVVAYLRTIANPWDETAFLRIVNVPRRGIGDVTLHEVHDLCRAESLSLGKGLSQALTRGKVAQQAEQGIRSFLAILTEFRRRFRECEGQLAATLLQLLDAIGYQAELVRTSKSADQANMRWANIEAMVGAMADYERSTPKPTLSGFLDTSSLDTSDFKGRGSRERRKDAVSLMTIHSAKGLEFPFVFVMGIEEGLLPHDKSMDEASIEEERRLFYVALTRGQRHVTLFEAMSRIRHGRERMTTTSRFATEIPEHLVNRHVRAARDLVELRVAPNGNAKAKPGKRNAKRGTSRR
ncbi:MAG: UvrD-helicase domain-containing protein [Candidatus Hydrogenedentes bacterium]|nr:UvrD-helicase domain-containing protein [Candidatus Hydrogenedentota bacterium]